jgi:hypothetical protein
VHFDQLQEQTRESPRRTCLCLRLVLDCPTDRPTELTVDCSYGLFKAADKKLLDADNLSERLSTVDKIVKE